MGKPKTNESDIVVEVPNTTLEAISALGKQMGVSDNTAANHVLNVGLAIERSKIQGAKIVVNAASPESR